MLPNGGTHSDMTVTEKGALAFTAVKRAVDLISDTLAIQPLPLYKNKPKGKGKEKAKGHDAYGLMNTDANSYMTSFAFRKALWSHVLLWGNGYAMITHNVFRDPKSLTLIEPWRVQVHFIKGQKVYKIEGIDGVVTDDKMIHIFENSLDGLIGRSAISINKNAIGLALVTEKFQSAIYGKGLHAGGKVQLPEGQFLDDTSEDGVSRSKALRESFDDTYGGHANIGKTVFLEDGMNYTPQPMMSLVDAEILMTRNFQVSEIGRMYGVPTIMLNSNEKLADQKVETYTTQFQQQSILPRAVNAEKELNKKLLKENERGRYFFKHNLDSIIRTSLIDRYEAHALSLGSKSVGWVTQGEIREMEDRGEMDTNDLPKPMNMTIPNNEEVKDEVL